MQKTARQLLTKSTSAAIAFMAFVPAAMAQIFGGVPDIGGGNADIRETTINILNNVLTFMALAAVAFIVIAGIRLIFSQGEDEQKDKAKKTIFMVIFGLILILFAQGIVGFIANNVAQAPNN